MTSAPEPRKRGPVSAVAPHGGDRDRGSLPMALLITLVAVSLSALLAPVVLTQISSTRATMERTRALHAAQAGIDTALGQIRAAADAAGNGLLEQLPACTMTGSLSPDGSLRPSRYRVEIIYQNVDGNPLGPPGDCVRTDVPDSALLISTGIDGPDGAFDAETPGARTIEATYSFQTTNANIVGGQIRLALANGADPLCMDAGPAEPIVAGTRLQMQTCQPGAGQQQFAYTQDLSLKLVGSESSTASLGMCLDAGATQVTNAYVAFQPCRQERVPRQQWSLNDNSNFQGTSNGATLNSFCFNLTSAGLPGSYVVLGACGTTANRQVFRPQTGVGTGMAGPATGQLVNYKQFSRCIDVTGFQTDPAYLIVWFCKHTPDGNIRWNQKWSTIPQATATGTLGRIRTVADSGTGYCLRSPGSTAAGRYVRLTSCPATAPATIPIELRWTVFGDTGDYATAYRIMDGYGNCLTPTDLTVPNPDTHDDGTSKVKVAACDRSELQKWNAPANLDQPLPLTEVNEVKEVIER
ncbi:ricin-type beta-trefoil lectin domain protein [Planomonospora sp. ID82291]|uniref:RICIN domain-containing protein n=1 Tax=Planomonospora sp. ID82291 TaxID=2738136 RepID=UPI0018C3F9D5|nr:ricin-type beta-trefoil lectin domain protein [Planomonospora sp. ID82291]MBG0813120.1 ricin-type beta-trefoil lectin domain protein [Planomonospora sp. ID82291]